MKTRKALYFIIFIVAVLTASICLSACSSSNDGERLTPVELKTLPRVRGNVAVNRDLYDLPSELYERKSPKGGKLTKESYATRNYRTNDEQLTKQCMVYTPYGYDKNKRYEIVYLMHGHLADINTLLTYGKFKNLFDNLIERELIDPIIVVTPTFAPHNETDELDLETANEWVKVFHNEFKNDLMPAVESKYHTYADFDTDDASLKTSKRHRAFAGFSLGSQTTWFQLYHNSDYIYRYVPMALDFRPNDLWTADVERYARDNARLMINRLGERGVTADDFVIEASSGSADSLYKGTNNYMKSIFDIGEMFTQNNTHYAVVPNGEHDFTAVRIDLFNALLLFYGRGEK